MIPCPSCGTRNRRGSKYCYFCGERLDVAFDVSCPACDRLNPVGSAFCAFCGAKIRASLPVGEPAAAERLAVDSQPSVMPQEHVEGEAESLELVPGPRPELPAWLYEESPKQPEAAAGPCEVSSPSVARPPRVESKYLSDIPGALPQTQGWLSSVPKPEGKPAASEVPQYKPKAQNGCLTLVLPILFVAAALALLNAM